MVSLCQYGISRPQDEGLDSDKLAHDSGSGYILVSVLRAAMWAKIYGEQETVLLENRHLVLQRISNHRERGDHVSHTCKSYRMVQELFLLLSTGRLLRESYDHEGRHNIVVRAAHKVVRLRGDWILRPKKETTTSVVSTLVSPCFDGYYSMACCEV